MDLFKSIMAILQYHLEAMTLWSINKIASYTTSKYELKILKKRIFTNRGVFKKTPRHIELKTFFIILHS